MIKARTKRAKTIRKRLSKTLPRLSVFRSNKAVYAQVIDDSKGITLAYAAAKLASEGKTRQDAAKGVGAQVAKTLKSRKIKKIVFDRGSYRYHGLVKLVAEGAKEGGLEF